MHLRWQPLPIGLIHPFRIAHGVSLSRENVLVRIDGGLGEAAAVSYLGETSDGIIEYLRGIDLSSVADPSHLEDLIGALPPGSAAARAAIDMALYDAWGQLHNQPLYRLLGLNPERAPVTSLTIAQASPKVMAERARQADSPVLKLKLGTDDDVGRLEAIRPVTRARLRADANAGWALAHAKRMLPSLVELDVELIEQPLAEGDLAGLRELSKLEKRPPIFVDESIRTTSDIVAHAGLVEGVVIKLAKSGGIRGALEQIAVARALGMEVMLGCMIETSVAVTAAAHIAALAQYADLDGPLLIKDDPFEGVRHERGRLVLPDGPGLGLKQRAIAG
jgi:L-alanine-DL-glutamate epimerase-like enolase superfamily enzyme